MKILFISDLHYGQTVTDKNGNIRIDSEKANQFLKDFFPKVNIIKPDLLVNMGDLIKADNLDNDKKRLQECLDIFKSTQIPILHLLGNHELRNLNTLDIKSIWQKYSIDQSPCGNKEIGDYNFVWLDFENSQTKEGGVITLLPKDTKDKLTKLIDNSSKKIILLVHYPIHDYDSTGNYLFDGDYKKFGLYNDWKDILHLVSNSEKVKAVFSAHAHWLSYKAIKGAHYITLPSSTENITAPKIDKTISSIYTIVNIDKDKLLVKCYSGEYCFASLELLVNNAIEIVKIDI